MRHHDVPARLIALVVVAACSGGSSPSQAPSKEAPRDARAAAAPIDAPAAFAPEIDRRMSGFADGPGCAVGVVRGGALVFARGYGLADVKAKTPIDPTTTFDLASTSKQFTAAVVLQLVDEGKLALDDPMTEYLPELKLRRGRAITIADLLHHTSGLPDYIGLLDAEYEDVTTGDDALAAIAAARPVRAPGKAHEYSNSGYFLLGQIVERITGRTLAEEAHDRIFGPLGMTHTAFAPGGQSAKGYGEGAAVVTSGWTQVGDGAVVSSVEDLARWAAAPLSAEQVTPGKLDDGTLLDYAAGLYVGEYEGHAVISHSGAWVGFGAELLRLPDDDLAVICLCNFDDSDPESIALDLAGLLIAGT